MEYKYVDGTTRVRDCDRTAAIFTLVLASLYKGNSEHTIESLKPEADRGLLWSRCRKTGNMAKVRIFWSSYYQRWIATTRADDTVCDNLLSQPIYRRVSSYVGPKLDACPIW